MSKSTNCGMNVFQIIFKSISIYIKNIIPLTETMCFPVFGIILGIVLILYPSFWIPEHLPKLIPDFGVNQSTLLLYILILLITIIPGFFLFTKAFWEFFVRMASLNSMIINLYRNNKLKDIFIHNQTIKLKSKDYVNLLLLISLIWLAIFLLPCSILIFKIMFNLNNITGLSLTIFLGIISFILTIICSVKFGLIFQIFAIEEQTPINTLKKSWNMVKGNFIRTLFIGVVAYVLTSIIIPLAFLKLAENPIILSYLIQPFEYTVKLLYTSLSMQESNIIVNIINIISGKNLLNFSKMVTFLCLNTIVSLMILPLSTAFYTLLYLDITKRMTAKGKNK